MKHSGKPDKNMPGRYLCTCGAAGLTANGMALHIQRCEAVTAAAIPVLTKGQSN